MGWTDKIHSAWNKFEEWDDKNVLSPGDTFSKIGAAYSSAADSAVGEAIGEVAKPVLTGAGVTLDALGYPLDRVKRGISTGAMISNRPDGSSIFDGATWKQAWDTSENVSAGQALLTDVGDTIGVGEFANEDNPWSAVNQKKARDFYTGTWTGRLSSGAVDTLLDFTVDPLVVGGKVGKIAEVARTTVKSEDVAGALSRSLGTANQVSKSEAKAGDRLKAFYQQTDGMSAGEMASLPQFKSTGDAGALAYFFDHANKEWADDEVTRHAMKADIFGAALGDKGSIDRIKEFSADIAQQVRNAGLPPADTNYLSKYSSGDYGLSMIQLAHADKAGELDALREARQLDYNRLSRVLRVQGSTNKIGSTLADKAGMAVSLDKVDGRLTNKLREYTIPNGLFGSQVRYLIGASNTHVPGHVNVKDATSGYQDVLNTLGQMKYTPSSVKRELADAFVKAGSEKERREAVEAVEARVFSDAAGKYGISQDLAEKLIQEARGRRAAYQTSMKSRLYSASPTDEIIDFYDPEDDVVHVFGKAFLQTHFEQNHELSDPRLIDDLLKKGTNRRLLERWAGHRGTVAANALDASRETSEQLITMFTRGWKDAALMRLAYPARIQMDTQARTLTHLGMMQYLMTRKAVFGGQLKYMLENKEGEKKLKDLFTGGTFREGDIDSALALQMMPSEKAIAKGKDKYKGVDIFPALTPEDVQRIRAGIESHGGAAADVGNDIAGINLQKYRASGDFTKVKAGSTGWFENWKRAVDQIRTSPIARAAVDNGDIDSLAQIVRTTPDMANEWANFSGDAKNLEEYLARIVQHVDTYLPTPELKAHISSPDKARDLFDIAGAEARLASVPSLKKKMREAEANVRDLTGKHGELVAKHKAAAKRSPERKVAKREKKAGYADLKQARNDAWQARAEYGDAKRPPDPGMLDPNTGLIDPMDVHGEIYSPLNEKGIGPGVRAFRDNWYKVVADAPETIMGRSPIYVDSFKQYMKDAVDRIGAENIDSRDIDEIRKAADRRSRQEVASILFDSSHSSNAAHAMRFVMPFFSAWEDTTRKWGKLFYDNPSAPLTAHKFWQAPNQAGWVHDSEGNYKENGKYYNPDGKEISKAEYGKMGEYIILPKVWGLSKVVPGDGSFKINKNALNVLFQGDPPWLPGNGPLVQVPVNEVVRRSFPDAADNPVLKYILPYGVTDDPVPYQLLPSWMKQVRDSGVVPLLGDSKDFSQTYAQLMAQETVRYNNGDRKSKPDADEIAGKTRMWYLLRAGLANASPISIQPTPGGKVQFYIDQAHQYRAKYGAKWQEKFYDDFPRFFELSLSLSYNETGIQATEEAYDATKKFRKQIRDNPDLGWFFVGPANRGDFNANVNTWQRSTEAGQGKNFRSTKDPAQALRDVEAQKGWIQYDQAQTFVNLELEKRGLSNLQQAGAEDLADAMKAYREFLGNSNTAWRDAYGQRDSGKAQHLLTVAKENWAKNKEFADRPDQRALKEYMDNREQVRQILATRPAKGLDNPANRDIKAAWDAWVANLKKNSLGFEQIYNRVLEADDLSQEVK
jgi:hypothetical protein